MTTNFQTFDNISSKFLVLGRNGEIRANSAFKDVLGYWKKGEDGKYSAGLHYNGVVYAYTKRELRNKLVQLANRRGITIKVSES